MKRTAVASRPSPSDLLAKAAEKTRQAWLAKRARQSTERPSLVEWVESVSPWLDRFDYFGPYAAELERAIDGSLRLVVAAPPQHGKTVFSLHAFLYWDRYFPARSHAYVTYNENRAEEVAKDFIRLAQELGFEPTGTLAVVTLRSGTRVKFTSIDGGLTGYPIDGVCLIDDPIKGPAEARSATVRASVVNWYKSVARTRRHAGTSFVAMATRWHLEDLSGYLVRSERFRYLNFKAIAEASAANDVDADGRVTTDPLRRPVGASLWARKPPEFFEEERRDAYWWASMYQGEPRPLGGAVFGEPAYYDELPTHGYRVAYGLDFAYSKKTHADYSVCIRLLGVIDPRESDPRKALTVYVDVVHRKQVAAPEFLLTLKAAQAERRGPMRWYASGTEAGVGDFVKRYVPVKVLPPHGDKLTRAQSVAAAWNAGRVLVPNVTDDDPRAAWVNALLDEVRNFTGVNDLHDDQIDALGSGFDEFAIEVPEYDSRYDNDLPSMRI